MKPGGVKTAAEAGPRASVAAAAVAVAIARKQVRGETALVTTARAQSPMADAIVQSPVPSGMSQTH